MRKTNGQNITIDFFISFIVAARCLQYDQFASTCFVDLEEELARLLNTDILLPFLITCLI